MDKRVSKNFTEKELACRGSNCCGNTYFAAPVLVKALQELRDLIGKAIHVNSCCRCNKHNKKVGGHIDSWHTRGLAVDIRVDGYSSQELAALADQIPEFGNGTIGVYKNFIHVAVTNRNKRFIGAY